VVTDRLKGAAGAADRGVILIIFIPLEDRIGENFLLFFFPREHIRGHISFDRPEMGLNARPITRIATCIYHYIKYAASPVRSQAKKRTSRF